MKILLASDSHGNNEALKQIVKIHPNMDIYLHLGDSESDEYGISPFISVRGNMDYFCNYQDYIIIPTPLGKLFATHKPPFIGQIKLLSDDISIVCHGHTHKRRFEKVENIIYINPGSISFPRDGNDLSYCIIEITKTEINNEFYSLR